MQRRHFVLMMLAGSARAPQAFAAGSDSAAALLRAGGCVVMIRHAQTEPGIGDPPEFQLGKCSTQRNLSDAGRAQARRIGQWFTNRKLQPAAVRSSAWCRCIDTADLAFGRHTVTPALNSTFADSQSQSLSLRNNGDLAQMLRSIPSGQFEVWVTHQVNISAFANQSTSMGQGLVIGSGRKLLDTLNFSG